jgi:hypothetical protein
LVTRQIRFSLRRRARLHCYSLHRCLLTLNRGSLLGLERVELVKPLLCLSELLLKPVRPELETLSVISA